MKTRFPGTVAALAMLPLAACAPELPPEPATPSDNVVVTGARPGQSKATAAADLQYYGGRVISNVQVEPVLWTASVDATLSAGINAFYKAVVSASSGYWSWLSEYNTAGQTPVGGGTGSNQTIGAGTVLSNVAITPGVTGTTIDDTQIQAELKAQIKAGTLPKPAADAAGNTNTYYPVFFPSGYTVTLQGVTSCQGFCAYHGTVAADATAGTPEFYYGVHIDQGSGSPCSGLCGGDATPFNNETALAAQELAEAATNAEAGAATLLGPPLAWYDASQGEIGDVCFTQQGTLPGTSYVVQKLWSNQAAACILNKGAVSAAITAPAAGSTVSGSVAVTATAATTFTGDTISSVAFSVDGAAIGTATAAPFSVTWDTTKVSNASHSLTAVATDSGGHTGAAAAVSVTVSNSSCASVTDPGTNTSIATALPLSGSCAAISGTISGSGNFFQLSLPAGATLAVTVTPPKGVSFLLAAYDQNGKLLSIGGNSLSIKNTTGAAVSRYFAVRPFIGSGAYTAKATW